MLECGAKLDPSDLNMNYKKKLNILKLQCKMCNSEVGLDEALYHLNNCAFKIKDINCWNCNSKCNSKTIKLNKLQRLVLQTKNTIAKNEKNKMVSEESSTQRKIKALESKLVFGKTEIFSEKKIQSPKQNLPLMRKPSPKRKKRSKSLKKRAFLRSW